MPHYGREIALPILIGCPHRAGRVAFKNALFGKASFILSLTKAGGVLLFCQRITVRFVRGRYRAFGEALLAVGVLVVLQHQQAQSGKNRILF